MDAEKLAADIAELRQQVELLRQEIGQMKAQGFVTRGELKRLVPPILQEHQMRNG